jgi:hypothetical protein
MDRPRNEYLVHHAHTPFHLLTYFQPKTATIPPPQATPPPHPLRTAPLHPQPRPTEAIRTPATRTQTLGIRLRSQRMTLMAILFRVVIASRSRRSGRMLSRRGRSTRRKSRRSMGLIETGWLRLTTDWRSNGWIGMVLVSSFFEYSHNQHNTA